jgi:MFS family permease
MTLPESPLPVGDANIAAADLTTTDTTPRRATPGFIAVYWFAQFANWLALLTPVVVTIALKVADITTPTEKAAQLGVVLAVGALASTIATPIWGAISDRTTARIGRRKLCMIVGVLGGGAGLAIMGLAPNIVVFGLGWTVAQIAFNANQAALNALLPDQVPEEQRGRVSGLLGLTATVSILLGTFITQYTTGNSLLMFLGPWFITVIALVLILIAFQDRPADRANIRPYTIKEFGRTFWVSPRKHPDFAWAFASRFLVFMGNAFIQTYGVYFLTDHLHVGPGQIATFIFFSTFINAAITVGVSVLGGYLSDKFHRRKPFVFVAAAILGVGLIVAGTSSTFTQYLVGAGIVAFGSGLYYAVDLALVAAVLPNPNDAAKDMGVFQIANALPQSLAPIIAPAFLAIGAAGASGNYVAVFIAGAVFAVIGAFAIAPVRGTH